ncbi:bacillithiol biosynthesis cysteine-adding enzyme BshC [Thalassobacillus pellis]|uniref:bacillithiol biosynthesis cysteine-adding enzyme BshC n=1 Tax=Thalassobacillus pellis TaxID=748008 RepID=UPI001961988F|nr:bacillithiol biosynthesis cysteine-adding enzyme BshC [Thalassobacillus pellis]MBM7552861.1 bacillithiol biosynthesis cysteine-adding enzyme BshC [Thalassobacillus pellis]
MRIDPINISTKVPFMKDYLYNYHKVAHKFDYNPFREEEYAKRLDDLQSRTFDRDGLADVLEHMNREWEAPERTMENINALRDPESVVVIGGQQAGLLTGPLYSVHKLISIIQFAVQAKQKHGVNVVPVFWIAGEDHDFDEINHVFLPQGKRMKKFQVGQYPDGKPSVSDLELDRVAVRKWIDRLFHELEETAYTNAIQNKLHSILQHSQSYVDFFSRLIFELFEDSGVVLVDSHHPALRKLESSHFQMLIENQPQIAKGVYGALQENYREGYATPLECTLDDAHLFYHHQGERILLSRDEDGKFYGKQYEVELTQEELESIAYEHPEQLSNNVITRPLMQELLFPSLAFIGGPGEVRYWSVLKPAFEAAGIHMPPVVPRISYTLIDRKTAKYMDHFELGYKDVIESGAARARMFWLNAQSHPPLEEITDQVKLDIERIHEPLRHKAKAVRNDLGDLAEKNLFHLMREVEFLEKRVARALEEKHERELVKFDYIDIHLHPEGGLQERTWGILPWANTHGLDVFKRISEKKADGICGHYGVWL